MGISINIQTGEKVARPPQKERIKELIGKRAESEAGSEMKKVTVSKSELGHDVVEVNDGDLEVTNFINNRLPKVVAEQMMEKREASEVASNLKGFKIKGKHLVKRTKKNVE